MGGAQVNVPKSPITVLGEALAAADSLKALHVKVLVGAKALPLTGAPPRIVIFPTTGALHTARKVPLAIVDNDQQLVAHLWGESIDHAWAILQALMQALEQQARGTTSAGAFYDVQSLVWDVAPDTTQQGQALEVTIKVPMAIEPAAYDPGHVPGAWPLGLVESTQQTKV